MSMDYEAARPLIQDGDLVAVRETRGLLTPFTKFFTGSPVTHVGIALWTEDGLMMGELNSGHNHLVPLSQLSETDFDVHYPPVTRRDLVRQAVMGMLRVKVDYSVLAMLVIGLLDWVHIRVFLHARRRLVCSGWCVAVYEAAGWPERTRIMSPRELASLCVPKLQVRKQT